VRPPTADIAAPEFAGRAAWLNGKRPSMANLTTAGPVLVHFFDFAQLNSIRVLPYLREWRQRYAPFGLTMIGVHSPRWQATRERAEVEAALRRLQIAHPVAVDSDFSIWADYGCEGWPSLFLWGQGGTLRWFHFGEGEYRATEEEIQALLQEAGADGAMPDPIRPLRETDAPEARVIVPTDEVFPGGSESQPWEVSDEQPELSLDYEAGGAFVTVAGEGEIRFELDGKGLRRRRRVNAPGLYELASHKRHESHSLRLRPATGQEVYSVSFAPGMP
jgi:hypothetical protein